MNARIVETLVAAGQNPWAALAVKSTLALLAALLLLRLLRGASAAIRHLTAAATFGVLLLLPLASALVPPRVLAVAAPTAAPAPVRSPAVNAPAAPAGSGAADTGTTRVAPAAIASGLYAVYLFGALGLAASLAASVLHLRAMARRADVSVAGTRLANEIARQEGLAGGIEVAVSSELAVPVTFGWSHPVILLPAETQGWDEAELLRAIRHELEHIARGDWATQVMARLALAVYWPHPFSWTLWRRLRLEAERACDDAVIRTQGHPETYAEQLVALARRLHGRGSVPALSMATRSNLGLRVDAILASGLRRSPRSRTATLAVAVAATAGVLAIGPLRVMAAALPSAPEDAVELRQGRPLDEALLKVSEVGDLRAMRSLLDKGARADAVIRGDGSPLIAAAREGHVEAIELLIAEGADVNRGVSGDGNPLTNAARAGHLEAVRVLLARGADIDAGVPGDGNALIMAAGFGRVEVVRYLLDQGASLEKVVTGDENALIHASEGGQAPVVRLLIDRGADVNARVRTEGRNGGVEWRTPLSMARRNGHDAVVAILLAAGARE
jgi:beta-lactamase regulating signal transducer with metallopeptidase domain